MSLPPNRWRLGKFQILWGDLSDIYDEFDRPQDPPPNWDTENDPEQVEAFMQWALDALDEFAPPGLNDALQLMQSDYTARLMWKTLGVDDLEFEEARRLMPHLTRKAFDKYRHGPMPKKPRQKPGNRPYMPIDAAVADNANLTTLFKRHFGKVQRKTKPTRETILTKRHNLTDDEWARAATEIKKARRQR